MIRKGKIGKNILDQNIVWELCIFLNNLYSENFMVIIENILKRQRGVLKQIKREMEQFKRSTIDARTFVILDDCLYDNTWARDKMMRLLFMNGELFAVVISKKWLV